MSDFSRSPHIEHLYGLIDELNEALRNAFDDRIVPCALRVEKTYDYDHRGCPKVEVGLIVEVAS